MFDSNSREIMVEVETDVYVLNVVLSSLPMMAGIIRSDRVLEALYDAMQARVDELIPKSDGGEEIEKMLVCGFSRQK